MQKQERIMMHQHLIGEAIPKFYGATTIGERGQVVIPAEARKDLNLEHSTKVMVFGGLIGEGLLIVKADSVAEMVAHANQMLSGVTEMLKSDTEESD
jgi:AbrB family looped-hinge helix DNA binding protein